MSQTVKAENCQSVPCKITENDPLSSQTDKMKHGYNQGWIFKLSYFKINYLKLEFLKVKAITFCIKYKYK